eukprot:508068-Lingulodinium_polyedra.AAC.1
MAALLAILLAQMPPQPVAKRFRRLLFKFLHEPATLHDPRQTLKMANALRTQNRRSRPVTRAPSA